MREAGFVLGICSFLGLAANSLHVLDDTQQLHPLPYSDNILAVVDIPLFAATPWMFETFSQSCGSSYVNVDGAIIPYDLVDQQYCVAACGVDLAEMSPLPELVLHNISGVIQDIVLQRVFPVPSAEFPLLRQSMLPVHVLEDSSLYAMEVERAYFMGDVYRVPFPDEIADQNNNTWYIIEEESICSTHVSAVYATYGFDPARLLKLAENATHVYYRTQIGGGLSSCGVGWLSWCLAAAVKYDFWVALPPPPPPLLIVPQSTGLAERMLLWVIGVPLAVLMVYLAVMHVVKTKLQ